MDILVFGKNGQVATELSRLAFGDLQLTFLGRDEADLTQPEFCTEAIGVHRPDAVINAAAYTAVDKAEEEEALAQVVNADAPAAMASTCADLGIPFLSISTDYVFSGEGKTSWRPNDQTRPQGAYGRTKLAGEKAVAEAGGLWTILRTSWVVSAHGNNFVKTMRRLGGERDSLNIVADQIGGPTPAADIANACLTIARRMSEPSPPNGIYHFSGAPDVSWADFAREIFNQSDIDCAVSDIPSTDFPTTAKRPLNSRMNCDTTLRDFGIKRPDWRKGLEKILTELKANPSS
ncbi:MAG: dTDP-4-dehydrorhamnose reductase [Pseudomonadota bacterium]